MCVQIEFFGTVRQATGVEKITLDASSLGEAVAQLADRFPRLKSECIDAGKLRPAYSANLNGDRFVSDPSTPLVPGDSLLILSADAGG